jgi:hypothetical protein
LRYALPDSIVVVDTQTAEVDAMMTTLGIALALGLAAPCTRITVRTLNVVPVEKEVLERAREVVEKVYRRSGTEIAWIDCPLDGAPSCATPRGQAEISLRIYRRSERTKRAIGESIGGLALPGDGGGIVHLHYDRLEEIGRGEEIPLELALGITAAHEIGHLLIGSGHSNLGVMRATLGVRDWHDAAQGALLFDREQTAVLRTGACRKRTAEGEQLAGGSQ